MKQTTTQAVIQPVLDHDEVAEMLKCSGKLGPDPISKNFAKRTKSIAFVICSRGRWFHVHQDFLIQAAGYNNGGGGGFKRYYKELPKEFIQSDVTQKLLGKFKDVCQIPEGELVIVQVQTNHFSASEEGKCLTGQGLHSDGANRAILACLKRDNVRGARNAVFQDRDAEVLLLGPTVLNEGEVMFWEDNSTYHYVEPATLDDPSKPGSRTVLIAHYPAYYAVTGEMNPENTLPLSGVHPDLDAFQ